MTINLDNLVRDLRFWQEEWQLPDDHVVTEAATVIECLRKGIQDYLDGNYTNPRSYRNKPDGNGKCVHLQWWYEPCEQCIDDHFTALLAQSQGQQT